MALVNAFGGLGLEETLRQILRAVSFARDSADRLRVSVDNAPQSLVYMNNSSTSFVGSTGTSPTYHTPSSWNSVDARVEIHELSQQNYQMTRNRWTIT